MSNRQIQPVRPRDYQLARQVRPRSLWGQLWTITLQPGYFFRTLPPMSDSRQWFWVAVLILGLIGLSAVRQEEILNPTSGASNAPIDFNSPPGTDLGTVKGSPFSGGSPSIVLPPGGDTSIPSDVPPATTTSPGEVSSTLTTALIAGSHILLGWFILALLLCEVPLFNGRRPSFGQNLQIAIWTTVPLGIMAGLQIVYYAAGGGVGQPGLSGLLSAWKPYEAFSAFPKSVALSFAVRLTLFWVWTLLLIYRGGRNALDGKRWAVASVIVAWSVVLVIIPVVTGTIAAEPNQVTVTPETTNTNPNNLPFNDTGLVDPLSQTNDSFPNNGTLPAELQFLVVTPIPTPESTSELLDQLPIEPTPDALPSPENSEGAKPEFTRAPGG